MTTKQFAATAGADQSCPCVSTLWVGPSLRWLEIVGLTSFVKIGQPVKLYTYEHISNVPDGVMVCDAKDIWTPPHELTEGTDPALIADIFRLYLMQKTDEIWVDGDIVALKPITTNPNGYAFGWEVEGQIVNNAILRTPQDSEAIEKLIKFVENPSKPEWMRPVHQNAVLAQPPEKRLKTMVSGRRAAMGPMALSWALRQTGEINEACPREAYYPVTWPFTDVFFSPYDEVEKWYTPTTCAVHLWTHLIRPFHKNHAPDPRSFIGARTAEWGIKVK